MARMRKARSSANSSTVSGPISSFKVLRCPNRSRRAVSCAGQQVYDLDQEGDGGREAAALGRGDASAAAQAVMAAAARRRDSAHNERFYDELDWQRRCAKRRARLQTAADEAFGHVRRLADQKGELVWCGASAGHDGSWALGRPGGRRGDGRDGGGAERVRVAGALPAKVPARDAPAAAPHGRPGDRAPGALPGLRPVAARLPRPLLLGAGDARREPGRPAAAHARRTAEGCACAGLPAARQVVAGGRGRRGADGGGAARRGVPAALPLPRAGRGRVAAVHREPPALPGHHRGAAGRRRGRLRALPQLGDLRLT